MSTSNNLTKCGDCEYYRPGIKDNNFGECGLSKYNFYVNASEGCSYVFKQ